MSIYCDSETLFNLIYPGIHPKSVDSDFPEHTYDKIVCLLNGELKSVLQEKYLKKLGHTKQSYQNKFGGAPIASQSFINAKKFKDMSLEKQLIKLQKCKAYKLQFKDVELPEWTIAEFTKLYNVYKNKSINYSEYIVSWIHLDLRYWNGRIARLKASKTQSLKWYILRWGRKQGEIRFKDVLKRKTVGFDHSPEGARRAGLAAAEKTRGKTGVSCRSVEWWINQGYTAEQAQSEVRRIQGTNGLSSYTKRHGVEKGTEKFKKRIEKWKEDLDTPEIKKSRSGGLWRYKERYGEEEGLIRYNEVRESRRLNARIGNASKESIVFFQPILQILKKHDIKFYCGIEGNREWFIRDGNTTFFYDLAIPAFKLIFEYHGEGFHPNPSWDRKKWDSWKQLFNETSADECHKKDIYKRNIAKKNGWAVIEVFSSTATAAFPYILTGIQNNLLSNANSYISSDIFIVTS